MKLGLKSNIAKSLLLARWKQTLVAAIGVTFSITMFITLLSFMNGLNDLLDGLILNRTPHIRLFKEIKPSEYQAINLSQEYKKSQNFIRSIKPAKSKNELRNYEAIVQTLKNDKRVLGFAPKIVAQIFYNVGATDLTGVINGVEPEEENRLFKFSEYIVEGNYIDLKNIPNSVILGKGLAQKMLTEMGAIVQVTTAQGQIVKLKVVGFFQSGLQELDKVQSYASIKTTQKLLGKSTNYVSDLQIKLNDMTIAPALAKEYQAIFDVDAEDIQTANSQFETGSSIRTLISYAVGITLLIVAGFGIYNILNMMIFEKMDSIAILKATGFSGNDVKSIFIRIALTIGLVGGLFGLLFGFLLTAVIDQIPFDTESLPTVKTFPVRYDPKYYIIGALFSIITTYFAGFFPARKASKIDPVIIIRGK